MTEAPQLLSLAVSPDVLAERRRALRALLRTPLLTATGGTSAEYHLVRRHFDWLSHWCANLPGWNLSIDKSVARLRKLPGNLTDSTRPAVDRNSGTTFTRRRYVLLCLVLAVLEQLDRQAELNQIAHDAMDLSESRHELQSAGFVFDCDNHDHRRDLMYAVRFLVDMGTLQKVEGDEKAFLNRSDTSTVLYEINRHALSVMLQGTQSPSESEAYERRSSGQPSSARLSRLVGHSVPATDEARRVSLQSRLVRSLLDDPVLYFDELNADERSYFEKHRSHLLREVQDATGLIAEVRREGIAMVDNTGDLTDIRLPDYGPNYGNDGQLILALVQWFAQCFKRGAEAVIPVSEVQKEVRALLSLQDLERNREEPEMGTVARLTHDLLLKLRALRLLQFTESGVVPLPASCRFADSVESAIPAAKSNARSASRP